MTKLHEGLAFLKPLFNNNLSFRRNLNNVAHFVWDSFGHEPARTNWRSNANLYLGFTIRTTLLLIPKTSNSSKSDVIRHLIRSFVLWWFFKTVRCCNFELLLTYKNKINVKTTIQEYQKTIFKTTIAIIALATTILSCSKSDDEPTQAPPVTNTKLALPAVKENNTELAVPDGVTIPGGSGSTCGSGVNPGLLSNAIEIDKDGIIGNPSKVTIEIDLTASYVGEVIVEIFTPSGESCALIKRPGTVVGGILTNNPCGAINDCVKGNKLSFNATFTDVALPSAVLQTGNYGQLVGENTFPVTVPVVPLNTFFMNKNIKGTWRLRVYDHNVGDRVTLNAWKIKFDVGALK